MRHHCSNNEIAKHFAGNNVDVIIHAVEKSLDSYKFNLLHCKQTFISQLKSGAMGARTIDEGAMDDPIAAARNFLNALERIPSIIDQYKAKNEVLEKKIPQLREIAGKVWKKEDELKQLKSELAALDRKIQLELAPPIPEVAEKEKEQKSAQHEGRLPHSPDPTMGIKTVPDTTDNPIVPVQRESEYNKHSFSKFRL